MYGDPELWHALLGRLADITISFLQVQVAAGASAVQLFDSWVGACQPGRLPALVLPHTSRIFAALAATGVPRIHFGVGTGELLGADGRGRRRRGRGRLADPAGRGRPAGGAGQGAAGQPGSRRSCSRPGKSSRSAPGTCSRAGAPPRGTCSTWGTASCRKPIPACWPGSPTWCTPSRSGRTLSGGPAAGLRAGWWVCEAPLRSSFQLADVGALAWYLRIVPGFDISTHRRKPKWPRAITSARCATHP